ncbi:MAG: polysaccharide biosynthesis tyrosine autokinase [Chloroflexi bacterium]|nr:polysaccharide biosynthesis tyrosine autokinase [Chloroflexota bacterium]
MDEKPFSDELRQYIGLIWRWLWILIFATILAGILAFFISKRMTPVYQASTTLLINEAPSNRATDYSSILTSERLARTYSEMLTKKPVLETVISNLVLDLEVKDLQKMINVELVRDTQLINIVVEDIDAVRAANIANELIKVFTDQTSSLQASRYASSKQNLEIQLARIDEQIQSTSDALAALPDIPSNKSERDRLETVLTQYQQTYASILQSYEQVRVAEAGSYSNVVQVEPATIPNQPIKPRVAMNTILAMLGGFLLTVGTVFLIESLDDTIRGPDDITRTVKLPVLGLILKHDTQDGKLVTLDQPRAPVAESFRSLRTNLQYASVDTPIRTLLVTSPSPSEGKTTIAANLGIVLAQSGRKVVLIDADLRRPRVHKIFNVANRYGMSNIFVQSSISLDGSLQKTEIENLLIMPSGELPPNPSELLGSGKMFEILSLIKEQADFIIIDSPPIMAVTDSAVLAPRVDGVLLVVKPGVTKQAVAAQAVEQLTRVNANILGVVLNEVDFSKSRTSYYQYKGYYYSYSTYYGDRKKKKRRGASQQPKLNNGSMEQEAEIIPSSNKDK